MMYANKPARIYIGHADQPYEGKHCYEYMMGLKEQCPFCPVRQLGDRESYETEVDNGEQIFAVKIKKFQWNGRESFIGLNDKTGSHRGNYLLLCGTRLRLRFH